MDVSRANHASRRPRYAGALAAVALLTIVASGCRHASAEGGASAAGDGRPKVTVAAPVATTVTEFSEQTGRAEAPEKVDVRARVAGHVARALFREGDLVKKHDLLFVVDPRPYEIAVARARADLASVRADEALAKRNAARAEELFRGNAIARAELDKESTTLAQLSARADVAAAALASAQLDVEYAYVRSPIDGRIGRAFVTAGNLVGPESPLPLATVVSVNPLYVYVDVDEALGMQIAASSGSVAQIGFAGEDGHPHTARIDFVDNRVDPGTGTLKVRAVVDNADGHLRDGLFARVRISQAKAHEAIVISDRAVGTDQDRRFVWVVGADGKVQYRGVKLGPLEGGLRIVREGLGASDSIVVRGLQRVAPGVEVAADTIAMRAVDGDPSKPTASATETKP